MLSLKLCNKFSMVCNNGRNGLDLELDFFYELLRFTASALFCFGNWYHVTVNALRVQEGNLFSPIFATPGRDRKSGIRA